jgi:cardiolipin synthase
MTNKDFTFYTNAEYWEELEYEFGGAKKGDRIAMIVMGFEPDEAVTASIVDALMSAADRGAEVHLIVDAYNFLIDDVRQRPGPLWWHKDLRNVSPRLQKTIDVLKVLDAKPTGHASIINMPNRAFTNPKGGRSHIKYTTVNDRIFVGGCNLHHTTWVDAMMGWRDTYTADYLYDFLLQLHQLKSTKILMKDADRQLALDPKTTLYLDAGKKRQSIILENALALIDAAEKSLVMTCQYFPNGNTAKHLTAAYRRGVDVQIIYAHPMLHGPIEGRGHQLSNARERLRVPAELFKRRLPKNGPGIHAKIIATEKAAIIGSHNYVSAGVLFGTAEIALLRHDPVFAQEAIQLIDRLVGLAE